MSRHEDETSPLLLHARSSHSQRSESLPLSDHAHTHTHSYDHGHSHGHASDKRTLMYACMLTFFFFIIELIGGYIAHSLAIMSDAAHLLSDLAGFGISLIAVSISHLPPNSRLSFGFARAEVLGAFVSVFFIWALTAVLVVFAVVRLLHPAPVNGPLMLLLGIIGLAVNIALTCVLGHSHAHTHAHTHAHSHPPSPTNIRDKFDRHGPGQHDSQSMHDQETSPDVSESHVRQNRLWHKFVTVFFGNDIQSINVRAAYLHVLGDMLQSIGVIIAALIIMYDKRLSIVDPLCTLLFAVLVILTTANLARDSIAVLMEATPPSIKLDDIFHRLRAVDGVTRVGDLHVWSISSNRPALSVHLFQSEYSDAHEMLKTVQQILSDDFGILHATVQINCETDLCDCNYLGSESQRKKCVTYHDVTPPSIRPPQYDSQHPHSVDVP